MVKTKKKKNKKTYSGNHYTSYRTNEDIAIFNEKKYENEIKKQDNVCDKNIDGA